MALKATNNLRIRWYRSTGWDEKRYGSDQNRSIFDYTSWSKPDFVTLVLPKRRHLLGKKINSQAVSENVRFDPHCDQSHLVWNLPSNWAVLASIVNTFGEMKHSLHLGKGCEIALQLCGSIASWPGKIWHPMAKKLNGRVLMYQILRNDTVTKTDRVI